MILYLLRHAKSSWSDPGLRDHDRPLAPRGERAATAMGDHLAAREVHPSLVLCSSARRAVETLERVLARLPRRPEVCVERGLYMADPAELLERVRRVDDGVPALMLVGHNPAMEELAARLPGGGDRDGLKRIGRKFPTAALAELHFPDVGCSAVAWGGGQLLSYCTPKDLG